MVGHSRRTGPASASRALRACAAVLGLALLALPHLAAAQVVDLQLVLAIDVSRSVDYNEAKLQRDGYVNAFRDPALIKVLLGGRYGQIGVTYLEWSTRGMANVVAPWTLIASPQDALAFAATLDRNELGPGQRTSISSAIDMGASLFLISGFRSDRRVIDISGDGPNNDGGNVALSRDDAVARGITINGLPILNDDGGAGTLPDLDVYYRECVIGGPGSFVIAAENFHSFQQAILRKLILEVADITPPGGYEFIAQPKVRLAQAGPYAGAGQFLQKYAPACDVGERRTNQPQQFPRFGP